MKRIADRGSRIALAGLTLLLATGVSAGLAMKSASLPAPASVQIENTPYNGKYVFARLRYQMGGSGMQNFGRGGRGGDPPWRHDFPYAEMNLMKILQSASSLHPGAEAGNIIDVGDPLLHKYPIAYMSEPGFWSMNEQELTNFRSWLEKGGFLIIDDFADRYWGNFAQQMQKLFPELVPVVLDEKHPIFHSFFDIETLQNLAGSYTPDGQAPVFIGYFEENDPTKRMLAIINFRNDLGENWEYAATGFNIVPEAANQAFKFGVNYIFYGLTH